MRKVRVTKKHVSGVLTLCEDGRYSVSLDGQDSVYNYYTAEQVEAVVARARANGDKVEVEY